MDEFMKIIEHNNVSIEARQDKSAACPTITILEESAFKLAR
jgi:hypothetical protein